MKIVVVAIVVLLCLMGITVGDVPSVEQRLISLDANKSAGNLTGDDYVILLIYAYIADYRNGTSLMYTGPECDLVYKKAVSQFPEYSNINRDNVGISIGLYMIEKFDPNGIKGKEQYVEFMETHTAEIIDHTLTYFSSQMNAARAAVQKRLDEESRQRTADAHRKALQQEAEKQREIEKQTEAAKQLTLDADYKNLSDQYAINISLLINQSKFLDALNLTNKAISVLAAPHRNAMFIRAGDICARIGTLPYYERAIKFYEQAQADFVYSRNDSDYQSSVRLEVQKLNGATDYKINATKQKRNELISAMQKDLRGAPNVKQLLSGHDGGRKYTDGVRNLTYWNMGYVVNITIDANGKPFDLSNDTDKMIQIGKDLNEFAPICVDMMGSLFADKRISRVAIQNKGIYIDKFGHRNPYTEISVLLNSSTATQIGDWNAFKSYVGTDVQKIGEVSEGFACNAYQDALGIHAPKIHQALGLNFLRFVSYSKIT